MTSKSASRFAVHPGSRLLIADMGISPSKALSLAGLPGDLFARKDAWLTPPDYFRLWHGIEEAGGSENIALALGRAISVEAFDPAIFASLCSPNLNVALSRIADYKRLIGPVTADVRIGSTSTELALTCYGYDCPLPQSLGAAEIVFFTQFARLATRCHVEPIRCELVTLPHRREECESFLGCRLRLGPSTAIRFSAADARRPFLTENPAMWELFEPSLRVRLSTLDTDATIGDRVRGVLLDMLPSGRSSIDEVARRLAISRRSLQRRLEKDDAPFRDLLSGVRRDLARHYLTHSDLAPGEISSLVGFEDPNSFLRAFKSWTGITPGEFRSVLAMKGRDRSSGPARQLAEF